MPETDSILVFPVDLLTSSRLVKPYPLPLDSLVSLCVETTRLQGALPQLARCLEGVAPEGVPPALVELLSNMNLSLAHIEAHLRAITYETEMR